MAKPWTSWRSSERNRARAPPAAPAAGLARLDLVLAELDAAVVDLAEIDRVRQPMEAPSAGLMFNAGSFIAGNVMEAAQQTRQSAAEALAGLDRYPSGGVSASLSGHRERARSIGCARSVVQRTEPQPTPARPVRIAGHAKHPEGRDVAKREDYKTMAADYLRSAKERDDELGGSLNVSDLRRYGAAYATLAMAQELSDLREALSGVEGALKDQDHIGIGAHARYISEALERIAKR
ncbi:hypothetical protein ACWDXH_14250 [Micromonospora chokoriensis]